jgi:hypothetical protein
MKDNILRLAWSVVGLAAGMALLSAAGLALDLFHSGYPLAHLLQLSAAEARQLNTVLARNYSQLLAVTFTTVAIAVPLTANMYSLKFLEFFIKDPVNAAVLTLMVFGGLNNALLTYAIKDDFVPLIQLHFSLALMVVCSAFLFPYLYYIFRFLHPHTLLDRLQDEIEGALRAAQRHPKQAAHYHHAVAEGIEHIVNIAVRSVDRVDRTTAIESIYTLEKVAHSYWKIKPQLPAGWFIAEPNLFLGFSSKAVAEFSANRIWVEMKLFSQMRQALSAAVPRMHDVINTLGRVLRRLGQSAAVSQDPALRELVVEYFNTFVRRAIVVRDVRSVFSLFEQYRTYAETQNEAYPELIREIAYYFQYYGQVARDTGQDFVVEVVAHDLATLVQHAWENHATNRQKLLERFMLYDTQLAKPLPGVKKAQAQLASYFLLAGETEAVALIRATFNRLDPEFIYRLADDLLHVRHEKFWEVNERRINMDYVPDDQRVKLYEFFESLDTRLDLTSLRPSQPAHASAQPALDV